MRTIVISPDAAQAPRQLDARAIVYPSNEPPFYIAADGFPVLLSPPGTRPLTSEDVRRELENFP